MVAPRSIDDRFVLEAEAASGGMGTVYRGRDEQTGAPVAIKILRHAGVADLQRFAREAAILADLVHPGIVRYVAHGILDTGSPYLVMDWVEGDTLEARLHGPGISVAESVAVAKQVASALAFAHDKHVVHRDIKPSNLIFAGGDLARTTVIDFGVARVVSQPGNLTVTGSVVGTPSYMAPEQVRGDREIGPAVDVFALGCVLYECITGRLTFEGARFLALRAKILLWDPPPMRMLSKEVPFELDQLVTRMLAKLPTDRPRDAGETLALLDALPAREATATQRRTRRHSDTPTELLRGQVIAGGDPPRMTSIVVAASADGLDASAAATMTFDALITMRGSLEIALRPYGASLDLLQDGGVIATLAETSTPSELAHRAASCALTIRRAMKDALIAIATGPALPEEEAALIEQSALGLSKDAMSVVFAGLGGGLPAGAIRVDATTASLIEATYPLVRVKGACYLPGG